MEGKEGMGSKGIRKRRKTGEGRIIRRELEEKRKNRTGKERNTRRKEE